MKRKFEVRVYSTPTAYRVLPSALVGACTWRVGKEGGYLDATLSLKGSLSDTALSGVGPEAWLQFWGKDASGDGIILYSGLIRNLEEVKTGVRTVKCTLYGLYERIARFPVKQRYSWPDSPDLDGADISVALSKIWNKWAVKYVPNLRIYTRTIGQTVQSLDAYRRTIGDTTGDTFKLAGGLMSAGCDIDPSDGVHRMYAIPYGDPLNPDHVWSIPSRPQAATRITAKQTGRDTRRICNVFDLSGGPPTYPNLMTRGAGMEYPTRNGEAGNLLVDPGFEASGAGPWTFGGGASEKLASNGVEGQTDGGDTMIELDADGEYLEQVVDAPHIDIVPGAYYTVKIRARQESGAAAGSFVDVITTWRDSGGTIRTDTFSPHVAPTTVNFADFEQTFQAPALTDRFTFKVIMPTGGDAGDGVMVDNVAIYNSGSATYAEGMEVRLNGGGSGPAEANSIVWAYEQDSHHGAYCLAFDVIANNVDNEDVSFRETNGPLKSVTPRGAYKTVCWVKNFPGETSYPPIQLQLLHYGDGAFKFAGKVDITPPVGGYPDWTPLVLDGSAGVLGVDANQVLPAWVIRGTGKGLIDSLMLTDAAAPLDSNGDPVYYESVFEAVYRADERFVSGPIHDSNATYGDVPSLESNDSIISDVDGGRMADAVFTSRATEVRDPDVELIGAAVALWPGQYVRGVGSEGLDIFPEPLPIVEIEGKYAGGKLTLGVYFATENPSEARTAIRLAREAAKRSGSGTNAVSGGGGGSGAGGGGSYITFPLTIAQGGTGADNAPDALTNLGIGGGQSFTEVVAKLTPGGTNGSKTYTLGIVTAHTDPT